MNIAFLFAGQGAQKVGMGHDFYTQNSISQAVYDSIHIDFDLREICFTDAQQRINKTEYTQACLLATSMAIAKAVEALGIHPKAVAGLSLGEYSALCFAQALDLNTALNLVRQRGLIMANALKEGTTSMSAVLNGDPVAIEKRLLEDDIEACGIVQIANFNSPKQIVLSGEVAALRKAEEVLKEDNMGRIIPLRVSGAFHSSLLKPASYKLENILKQIPFNETQTTVYYNVIGNTEPFSKDLLTHQICEPVLFEKMIKNMIKDGMDTFIEIGPGKTLSSFVRQIDENVSVYTVDSIEHLDALKGLL